MIHRQKFNVGKSNRIEHTTDEVFLYVPHASFRIRFMGVEAKEIEVDLGWK